MIRSLNSLRAFLSVAHHSSFAKAAAQLNLSSSSISRHITELEREVGVTLLTRSTRKVAMTAAGIALFEQATPLLTSLDDLGNNLKANNQHISGKVSLSAQPFQGDDLTKTSKKQPIFTIY